MRIPAHSVCTAIRDDIVSGVYERGGRLTEELLARRYGVSRVPVREALRTLESEGFVVTRRHAGACVAEPTEQEAADLLEVRTLLEPLGAARAAQRRTDAHLKVLRGLVRLGQERARRGEGEDLRSLGGWFHETLAQASGSPGLIALLTQLRHKIAWMYTVEQPARPAESWAEHGAIVDAVARGDAERARALAAHHAERSTAAHRLRRPDRNAHRPASRVSTSQHGLNIASGRH
ncbi:GntR family transcriptional regulator [Streptomyces sp. NPDC101181]|uniref:GntR family transcriptional regulator n=1 Tax=Streptomyces sp. NPDC101181 TaxID=3366125 RepID=UPI003818724F